MKREVMKWLTRRTWECPRIILGSNTKSHRCVIQGRQLMLMNMGSSNNINQFTLIIKLRRRFKVNIDRTYTTTGASNTLEIKSLPSGTQTGKETPSSRAVPSTQVPSCQASEADCKSETSLILVTLLLNLKIGLGQPTQLIITPALANTYSAVKSK